MISSLFSLIDARHLLQKKYSEVFGYDKSSVGKSLNQKRAGIKLESIFGNLKNGGAASGRTKDTKQKCKSAKYRAQMQVIESGAGGSKEKTIEQEIEALDESLLSDDSGDEFDSMVLKLLELQIIYSLMVNHFS